ncbi:DDB1- and CUL4-associated factor 11 [Anopheles ziemanni]|uniref:DDB1- and CUL4-associated factor 11 n=1 Tax=Anopheles ziemanni TaxID=345580 RepID=UPI00265A8F1A|nr:DDB1- and CUL4-associated factor 11 isoform X2 [Anopheles coustani]XP_058172692.1 DDB1- and CUL4-associated factor 11 [Anopheles ziemanni]
MGNNLVRNRVLDNMSDAENGNEEMAGHIAVLHDRLLNDEDEHDELDENEFASILRQLIRSGDIMVLNYENFIPNPLPVIKKKPNLDKLKQNAIYHHTKNASGHHAIGSSTPADGAFSLVRMISDRQRGLGKRQGPYMRSDQCKINNHFRPNEFTDTVHKCDAKVFCGQFTNDGNRFVTASQDTRIRVFDSSRENYILLRSLVTKHVSWSILDIDFSSDGTSFVYSTWADALFLSRLDNDMIDRIHSLYLNPDNQKLGVFTVCYSSCGTHILCGANDGNMYAYDLKAQRRSLMAPVAPDLSDVNSVGFVDDSSNIFFSGTDQGIIKLWDRRCTNEAHPEAIGKLIGHYDGVTYIDSRNDGRYIISNSKDQSIKLWDLRQMAPQSIRDRTFHHRNWDYRWDEVPRRFFNAVKPLQGDTSIMTYRGHKVQKSLIRAKFSPAQTTGQRYIYTGCGTGRLIIYDVLTGAIVEAIEGHHDIVRDVAWHPHRSEIITCSWDHAVHRHTYCGPVDREEDKEEDVRKKSRPRQRNYENDSEDDDEEKDRPIRRSRRLAEKNNSVYRTLRSSMRTSSGRN